MHITSLDWINRNVPVWRDLELYWLDDDWANLISRVDATSTESAKPISSPWSQRVPQGREEGDFKICISDCAKEEWLADCTNKQRDRYRSNLFSSLSLSVLINLVRTSKGADLIVGAIERVPDSGVLPGMHAMCRHVVSSFNTGKTWGQIWSGNRT